LSVRNRICLIFVFLVNSQVFGGPPEPLVPKVREAVQPEMDRHLAEPQKATLTDLAKGELIPAHFKPPLRTRALKDPWGALIETEKYGLDLAAVAAGGPKKLPEILSRLDDFLERSNNAKVTIVERGKLTTLDDHLRYIARVLDAAHQLRDDAISKLSKADRELVFGQPAKFIDEFSPQVRFSEKRQPQLRDDLAFITLWQQTIRRDVFRASVRTFLQLTDPAYLDELKNAMASAGQISGKNPIGMTGEMLAVRETRHGLIVLAGSKQNTFKLDRPVAFLADLGGDDLYQGTIASSFDMEYPFSILVDFSGDDTYEGSQLGLATGRLGCGCLIDRGGNDIYKVVAGGGGCGFAGVGILVDESGHDKYKGGRFSLGSAAAGSGLLLDVGGDDVYSAPGYSLGLGAPCGVGAIVDLAGDDRYRCGFEYGSGYNSTDAPTAKPGDANYQYDAFGLGVGLGRRTYPFSAEGDKYNLAGGVGVWIDVAGNDRSESSNFSQACSYFFGIGLKMDFAGNDHHNAGRYGLAAGAHYGMGLFLDYEGDDTYAPAGPVYTAGCAWDRSVFLIADRRGNDIYDFIKSSGPGRGDRGGWGIFADLEGRDKYKLNGTQGAASDQGVGVFFDGGGDDEYSVGLTNMATKTDGKGGLFRDR